MNIKWIMAAAGVAAAGIGYVLYRLGKEENYYRCGGRRK